MYSRAAFKYVFETINKIWGILGLCPENKDFFSKNNIK